MLYLPGDDLASTDDGDSTGNPKNSLFDDSGIVTGLPRTNYKIYKTTKVFRLISLLWDIAKIYTRFHRTYLKWNQQKSRKMLLGEPLLQ